MSRIAELADKLHVERQEGLLNRPVFVDLFNAVIFEFAQDDEPGRERGWEGMVALNKAMIRAAYPEQAWDDLCKQVMLSAFEDAGKPKGFAERLQATRRRIDTALQLKMSTQSMRPQIQVVH